MCYDDSVRTLFQMLWKLYGMIHYIANEIKCFYYICIWRNFLVNTRKKERHIFMPVLAKKRLSREPKKGGEMRWLLCPVNYACSDDLAFLPLKGGYLSLNPSPVHAILLFPRRAVSIRQPESSLSKWSLLKSLSARWKQVRSNRGQQVG